MKKFILYILIIQSLIATLSFGQTEIRNKTHTFKFDIALIQTNFDGSAISPQNKVIMEQGWSFKVRNIIGDNYIIQVSKFTNGDKTAIAQNLKTYQNSNNENIYFKLNAAEYISFAEELKRKGNFVVGASTTLMKIRPGNNKTGEGAIFSEFGNDFNIGVTAGWRINDWKRDLSLSLVGGLGISSIKVTPQTTKNFITYESIQSSISYNVGTIIEIQRFQISGFIGIDTMSGETGNNWIYRNKPWFGLGFGYEIFKPRGSISN